MSEAPRAIRRALVTGASGALGEAIAERLGRDGVHVVAHANGRIDAARAVAARIAAAGGSAEAIAFDVTDADAARAACERLLEGGPIQVVVNNAGVHDDAVFPGMRAEQWHRVIDVSLHGFFNVTQPLVLPMVRTRWGRIVNVSSVGGLRGGPMLVHYAAAKAGVVGFTKSLAVDLGPKGITVNAVAPGLVDTPMLRASGLSESVKAAAIAQMPIRRLGTPDDVAAACLFLVSEAAGWFTGQVVSPNGGGHL